MLEHRELESFVTHRVVLDTDGAIVYLGRLDALTPAGFWLSEADVHDCRDGHDTKEAYVLTARREGIAVNRAQVFIMREKIMSVARLDSVVAE